MNATLDQKAQRLRLNGRVRELPSRTFVVAGDTGNRYVVIPNDPRFPPRCDCPAFGGCSHLAAANGVLLDENEGHHGAVTPGAPDPSRRVDESTED